MIGSISQLFSTSAVSVGGVIKPSIASAVASQTKGTDFSQVLARVSADAVDTIKQGEAMSIAGIEGKASVQQVVESIMSAEQTLQAAVAIRDKVVGAYQQISQMAI